MISPFLHTLTLGLTLSPALAKSTSSTLYATHYSTSSIHTLTLTHSNSTYSLTETSSLKTCGTYPSWITLDTSTKTLYCSDEYGWRNANQAVNGSLTALNVGEDGSLSEEAVTGTAPGSGVHNAVYEGEGGEKYLAVAHYSGSAVSTYALPLQGDADPLQVFEFELTTPGTVPDRQEAPHPHQTLLDPTGSFVLVPDLGADLIRVFAINKSNGELETCPSLNYTLGGGPRHGIFRTTSDSQPRIRGRAPGPETVLYVAGELNGEVEAFAVSYPASGCLSFKHTDTEIPYPSDLPDGASLAEIRLVEDDLYVSVRLDSAFDGDDSLARLDLRRNGKVEFEEISTSGGVLPRTFAINNGGDLVAVGNQISSTVVIVERDPETGVLGEVVAELLVGVPGAPNTLEGLSSIIWNE
ncbi:Lactonase, 7-bladed beta-propeller-domain-containing protein [Aspergillus recurvatus]